MRAFLAVPADRAWREGVHALLAGVKPALPRASWTRPEAWHLTLRFLGEITPQAAEQFAAEIGGPALELAAGEVTASEPVAFPPRGRPRVLGIGFSPGPMLDALAALAGLARAAARSIGGVPEDRPFSPHVTLARIRDPWPAAAVEDFFRGVRAGRLPAWRVSSIILYESRLDPAGAVHIPLREWTAGSAARVRA